MSVELFVVCFSLLFAEGNLAADLALARSMADVGFGILDVGFGTFFQNCHRPGLL